MQSYPVQVSLLHAVGLLTLRTDFNMENLSVRHHKKYPVYIMNRLNACSGALDNGLSSGVRLRRLRHTGHVLVGSDR